MERTAVISADGVYRYALGRTWAPGPRVLWVMLNPSTADAEVDDATLQFCMGFTRTWDCGGLDVVNLFALRSREPEALRAHPDPVGPHNDETIVAHATAPDVAHLVVAWGAHPMASRRAEPVLDLLDARPPSLPLTHLGLTKSGAPRHPLYRPLTTPRESFLVL